jgi:hypothetical protein
MNFKNQIGQEIREAKTWKLIRQEINKQIEEDERLKCIRMFPRADIMEIREKSNYSFFFFFCQRSKARTNVAKSYRLCPLRTVNLHTILQITQWLLWSMIILYYKMDYCISTDYVNNCQAINHE